MRTPARSYCAFLAFAALFAQAPDSGIVLRFDVDLVQVDAVVTDSAGRRVSDLGKDDFQILQDGKPQRITNFSYVSGEWPGGKPPAPSSARQPARSDVRRAVVLVIDEYDLRVTDFLNLQQALGKYVEQWLQPGDLVAMVRTSGGSGALQQFTSDRDLLRLAVRRMRWKPGLPLADRLLKPALIESAQALAGYPGRKSIVVIGRGRVIDGGLVTGELLQDLREISDAANRASVAIDTIDIRGLALLTPGAGDGGRRGGGQLGRSARAYRESQTYLQILSESTGGLFQGDDNDIAGAIRSALEDAGGYYLLAWHPGADAFKRKAGTPPSYHELAVNVLRKGLHVRSRQGFFAFPGSGFQEQALNPEDRVRQALFSPFRSGDMAVQLTPSIIYDPGGASLESVLRIEPKGVEFRREPDGCHTASLELLMVAVPLDAESESRQKIAGDHVSFTACGDAAQEMMRDGLVAMLRQPVAPGHYQVRVAARNDHSDSPVTGSAAQTMEVRDLRKEDVVISELTLWSGKGAPPQPVAGTSYRLVTAGDPAVRQFRPNDSLNYSFRLLPAAGKASAPLTAQVKLIRGPAEIYASPLEPVEAGRPVAGTYRLDAAALPGQYLFGVIVTIGGKQFEEWLDLEIV